MTPLPDLAVRSRRVIVPEGEREAAVLVRSGTITSVVGPGEVPAGVALVDVGSSVIMPGLVDTHVHVNEPGRTEWEGFETATRAAAAGGITTLVDMPLNSIPVTTSVTALEQKRDAARGRVFVDCGFWGGVVPGNAAALRPMCEAGALGFKAFLVHSGIDDFPAVTEADLREAMPVLAAHGVPLLAHAELAPPGAPAPLAPPGDTSLRLYPTYLESRPKAWENDAVRLLIELSRQYLCHVHVVHLASAPAAELLAEARREGLPMTAETCPHYLFFEAEEVPEGRTDFKCAPPIREGPNREGLWAALQHGVIDFVVSDHSPCVPSLKGLESGDFMRAWGGIASLQLSLPAVWTEARRRGFSVVDLARWMSRRPAEFAGLGARKGLLAAGYDADLVVWDPEASFTVEPAQLHHRHKLTPYTGRHLQGVVEMTFVRGARVYDQGVFAWSPTGELL